LNKTTNLKSASDGKNQKNIFCKGEKLKKKNLQGGKAIHSYFAGGKYQLTQYVVIKVY
jgi:translation elongation factor P/translation initiation factor 5A